MYYHLLQFYLLPFSSLPFIKEGIRPSFPELLRERGPRPQHCVAALHAVGFELASQWRPTAACSSESSQVMLPTTHHYHLLRIS